jgi:hypothetical protein
MKCCDWSSDVCSSDLFVFSFLVWILELGIYFGQI